uniref:Uncharacterized protein n=1 Tax=Tetranychus urticae TaxID=32264 RepID=T1KH88_TETUR
MLCLHNLIPLLTIPKATNSIILQNQMMLLLFYLVSYFLEIKPCTCCTLIVFASLIIWFSYIDPELMVDNVKYVQINDHELDPLQFHWNDMNQYGSTYGTAILSRYLNLLFGLSGFTPKLMKADFRFQMLSKSIMNCTYERFDYHFLPVHQLSNVLRDGIIILELLKSVSIFENINCYL